VCFFFETFPSKGMAKGALKNGVKCKREDEVLVVA
jgi:hypothetical protein